MLIDRTALMAFVPQAFTSITFFSSSLRHWEYSARRLWIVGNLEEGKGDVTEERENEGEREKKRAKKKE